MRKREEIRRAREELEELEATRLRISGAVMRGNPGALEEDRRLEEPIRELAHWLVSAQRKDKKGGAT